MEQATLGAQYQHHKIAIYHRKMKVSRGSGHLRNVVTSLAARQAKEEEEVEIKAMKESGRAVNVEAKACIVEATMNQRNASNARECRVK